jgi:hypothetical protein
MHNKTGLTQKFIFATDSLIKKEKICESVAYLFFLYKAFKKSFANKLCHFDSPPKLA